MYVSRAGPKNAQKTWVMADCFEACLFFSTILNFNELFHFTFHRQYVGPPKERPVHLLLFEIRYGLANMHV